MNKTELVAAMAESADLYPGFHGFYTFIYIA